MVSHSKSYSYGPDHSKTKPLETLTKWRPFCSKGNTIGKPNVFGIPAPIINTLHEETSNLRIIFHFDLLRLLTRFLFFPQLDIVKIFIISMIKSSTSVAEVRVFPIPTFSMHAVWKSTREY